MSRKTNRIVAVALASAALTTVPAGAAYAYRQNFSTSNMKITFAYRYPSSAKQDQYVGSSTNGKFMTDVAGCPKDLSAYNTAAIRDRTGLPDSVEASASSINFCAPPLVDAHRKVTAGKYHFNVLITYYPQDAGTGYTEIDS